MNNKKREFLITRNEIKKDIVVINKIKKNIFKKIQKDIFKNKKYTILNFMNLPIIQKEKYKLRIIDLLKKENIKFEENNSFIKIINF